MGTRFSLLIASGSEDRAAALAADLSKTGLEPAYTVVDNIHDLSMALAEEPWDAVASDEDLPGLPWSETMALARAVREDVPFVLLTMDQSPDTACQAMRQGADDVLGPGDWRTAATFTRLLRESSRRRGLAEQWQRLHDNESTYRGMIDNSVLGIFQCTPWGGLVTFNPSFARILGHDSPEALGRHLTSSKRELPLAPDHALEALLQMVSEREFVSDFEARIIRRDGSLAWVSITARALRDETDEVSGIEGTIEDIGKRKAVETMIIRAKQEWEKTFDSVPAAIAILDGTLKVRRLNMALATRLGVHPKDLVGRNCAEVFDLPGEPPEAFPRIRRMAKGSGLPEEIRIPALGGWFLVTVSPFEFDDSASAGGFVLAAHDVSQRKELEAKLRQSQKLEAIGTLAGGIAHDFNNILGVIMGYTEMTQEESAPGTPAHRRLTEVLQAGRRARDLIHQILTFSRQEELELHPLTLDSVVKEALKLLRAGVPANVDIILDLEPTAPVQANLSQLHQVLMNLCTNAAHAMRDGGRLSITLDQVELDETEAARSAHLKPGPYVRLTVADTGHGIPEEIQDKVFDPFFTTKKPDEGTGMGLAMVHGIVTGHGGSVSVRSAPGQGATFEILLPQAGHAATISVQHPATKPSTQGGRALLVDDEAALANIVGEMLESLGYQAEIQTDSAKALERFRQDPTRYDFVVTDQTMPGLTGTELVRQLLAIRPGLPVVLCTGFSKMISAEQAREMGIASYLHKPVLKQDLAQAIQTALATQA